MDCKIILNVIALAAIFLLSCPHEAEGFPHQARDGAELNVLVSTDDWNKLSNVKRDDEMGEKIPQSNFDPYDINLGPFANDKEFSTEDKREVKPKDMDYFDYSVIPLPKKTEHNPRKRSVITKIPATLVLLS